MTFPEVLKRRVDDIGQEALAAELGVSQSTVSRWMSGDTAPSRRHFPALLLALAIEREELAQLMVAPTVSERLDRLERQMEEILAALESQGR